LKIAVDDYMHAGADLLDRVSNFNVEKVVIPIGSDFLHYDNWLKTTASGTLVDSTDDRFQKVFRAGVEAVRALAVMCREIADVELLWIPGNHDSATSWYMSEVLKSMFAGDSRVTVDNGAATRKYRLYGITLIGYDHGDGMPLDRLPLVMASEATAMWGKSVYRTYRVGHFHKKRQTKYLSADTFNGVDVTVLPSLSGTDKWHYEKGFIGGMRTAEAALWSKSAGPVGSFSVEARSAIAARKRLCASSVS
jgi:hypothetical protein